MHPYKQSALELIYTHLINEYIENDTTANVIGYTCLLQ